MRWTRAAVLAGFVMSGAGCATFAESDRDAKAAALAVYKQVITMKQAVRRKVEAEERYYRTAIDNLEKVRETREFLGVSNAVKAEAHNAVDQLTKPMKVTDAQRDEQLAGHLEKGARETLKVLEAGIAARRQQREALAKNLQTLRDLENEYAALEQTLSQLSVASDRRGDLKALARFVEQAADHYRKLEEAAKKGMQ